MAQDLNKSLYSSIHLNLTSTLPRPLLEEFANQVARDGTGDNVKEIFDQYLDFVVLENGLFELLPGPIPANISKDSTTNGIVANGKTDTKEKEKEEIYTTYQRLNHPKSQEKDVELETDRIAKGLFSTLATMGE